MNVLADISSDMMDECALVSLEYFQMNRKGSAAIESNIVQLMNRKLDKAYVYSMLGF